MTEQSYTAWDDKLYQWPPPEGWYEASDGKWWPEGYGPEPAAAGNGAGGENDGGADAAATVATAAGSGLDAGRDGVAEVAEALNAVEASEALAGGRAGADDAIDDVAGGVGDRASDAIGGIAGSAGSSAREAVGSAGEAARDLLSGFGRDGGTGPSTDGNDLTPGEAEDIAGVAREAAEAAEARGADLGDPVSGLAGADLGDAASGLAGTDLGDAVSDVAGAGADLGDAVSGLAGAGDIGSTGLPGSDDVSAALAETLAVRSDESGPGEKAAEALGGMAERARDTAGGLTDRAADLGGAAGGLGDRATSGLAGLGDRAGDALGGMADRAGSLGGAASGLGDRATDALGDVAGLGDRATDALGDVADLGDDDADATQVVADAAAGLDPIPGSTGSGVDLDALPPPQFDPPPASAPAEIDGATTLDRAAQAFPATGGLGAASDRASDALGDIAGLAPGADGFADRAADLGDRVNEATADAPSARSLFPPPSADRGASAPPSAFGGLDDPAETLAIPEGGGYGGGGLGAETGPLAGSVDHSSLAATTGGGSFGAPSAGAPPAGDPWAAEPPPSMAGRGPVAGSATTGWEQSDYGGPGGGGFGLDPAELGGGSRSGTSRVFVYVALGLLALVVLGALAYLAFGRGGDDTSAVEQTGPGSFAQPHAQTTGVEVFYPVGDAEQRWVVEVVAPVRDATAEAAAGAVADGQALATTTIRVRNQNPQLPAALSQLRFNAVTAGGEIISREGGGCPELPGGLDGTATLPAAGVAEGVVCWPVPAANLPGLLLGIESTEVGGRIHVALQ